MVLTLAGVAILAGCNDTLRQFIITVPKPGGTPATQANAVVLSTNPTGNGSNLHIDVSGDDVAAIVSLGANPIFLGKTGSTAVVINGDGTVTSYLGLLALSTTIHTSVMPAGVTGSVAGGTSSSGNFFITNSTSNNLSVFASGIAAVDQILTVGTGPVAVAGNAANSKMYVINQGSGDVTVISTVDNFVFPKTIPVGSRPIWAVMSADGVDVFVVNQGDGTAANPGSISVIDTTLDIVIPCTPGPSCDPVTHAISVGNSPATSSPNFAFYDTNRQRLYVNNTGENTISVIKADGLNLGVNPQIVPQLLANISVKDAAGNPHLPTSVTALSDGSKVYAALGDCPAGTNHTNLVLPDPTTGNLASCNGSWVSVIDATALRQVRAIQVGPGAVSIDSSGDASRVYVVSAHDTTIIRDDVHAPNCTDNNCLSGSPLPDRTFTTPSVYVIRTSQDQVFVPPTSPSIVSFPIPTFHAPTQDPNCVPAIDPNFNDDVPMPCAEQIPFMVRIIP